MKQPESTRLSAIWVYSVDDGKTQQLTSGNAADSEPVFDPLGRYLYFLSNRDFRLTFSGFEFNYVYTDPTRVYVGVLSKTGPALFLPQSDEEPPRSDECCARLRRREGRSRSHRTRRQSRASRTRRSRRSRRTRSARQRRLLPRRRPRPAASPNAPDVHPPAPVTVRIDADGFERRVRAIPGPPADIRSLQVTERAVLYLIGQGPRTRLAMYDIDDKKESTVLTGISGYELSRDGKKVLFSTDSDYGIGDVKADQKTTEGLLALDRLTRARRSARRVEAGVHGRLAHPARLVLRPEPRTAWTGTEVRDRYAELLPSSPIARTSTTCSARWPASSAPATSTCSRPRATACRGWKAGCSAPTSGPMRRARSASRRSTRARTGTRTSDRR